MLFVGDRQAKGWRLAIATLAYGLPLIFIVAPLLSFLTYSFFWVDHGALHFEPTLKNYIPLFTYNIFMPMLLQSCLLCLAVAVLAVLIGYPVAFRLVSLSGRRKYVLLMLVLVPLLMSYIIKIYAIRSILGGNGFLNRFLVWADLIEQPLTLFV